MLMLEKLMRNPRVMKAVFGLDATRFKELSERMEEAWFEVLDSREGRLRAPGAGQPSKIAGGAHKLAFILFYLKVYPTFDVMSVFSGINAGDCCRWMHNLMPVLEKLLGQKLALPKRKINSMESFAAAFPQAVEVMLDGTERPVQRAKKKTTQRAHYSGKKKRHTRKALVLVDGRRRIGYLSKSKRGSIHDKRLAEKAHLMGNIPARVSVLVDSGFQGLRHPGLCQPVKANKWHPELSAEQRDWNGLVSSCRVLVEHAIGGMKRYAAASGIYRNRLPRTDDRFNLLAAGLWNYCLN